MSGEMIPSDINKLVNKWLEAERNGVIFPVPFDTAWVIAGYSRKDNAKRKLLNSGLIEGEEFAFRNPAEWTQGGRSSDLILMTCDAFKQFCLMAKTAEGREIRLYFIEAEKKWKQVQERYPQVAAEIEDDGIDQLEALGHLIQGMIVVKKEQRQLKQTLAEQEQQIEANRRLIESQETKLARIEGRVVEFDRIRTDAATALINLPAPTEAAPVETTDQKIRRMVNDYCTATGAVQQDCYRNLYQQDYLRNRRRVTAHKQSRETHLQAYVRLGWVESLYSVAFSLFCAKTGDYSGDVS